MPTSYSWPIADPSPTTPAASPVQALPDLVRNLSLGDDGDLDMVAGQLVLTRGVEAIRQSADFRLSFFKGQWFLNPNLGIDYFGSILVKNPDLGAVTSIYRDELLAVPGIASVGSFTLSLDAQTRILTGPWAARADTGQLVASTISVGV